MTKLTKNAVLSGSILGLALTMGVTAVGAKPGNSQASEHMSQTAKDKLQSLHFPGNTKAVVASKDDDTKDDPAKPPKDECPVDTKC